MEVDTLFYECPQPSFQARSSKMADIPVSDLSVVPVVVSDVVVMAVVVVVVMVMEDVV